MRQDTIATEKCWGTTTCITIGHGFESHHLKIIPFAYCSRHKHLAKWNLFYVLHGQLVVQFYDLKGAEFVEAESFNLFPGETLKVPPGVWHRFITETLPCECIETYWTDPVDKDDILRSDVGGRVKAKEFFAQKK